MRHVAPFCYVKLIIEQTTVLRARFLALWLDWTGLELNSKR